MIIFLALKFFFLKIKFLSNGLRKFQMGSLAGAAHLLNDNKDVLS